MRQENSRFAEFGAMRTHYLDFPGGDPPVVLLHGLSANAHEFCGLIDAGLSPQNVQWDFAPHQHPRELSKRIAT